MRPPFKIHGGKYYLASWILEYFPLDYRKLEYVEPFVGAASLLFAKDPSKLEVISDINPGTVAIYRALKDNFSEFIAELKSIPYSEESFLNALKRKYSPAANAFVKQRMSRGGMGTLFAYSTRLRGGIPGDIHAWNTILQELHLHSNRLKNVRIENRNALYLNWEETGPDTFVYLDPPYLSDTRTAKTVYEFELTNEDHKELLLKLLNTKAKVLISGYNSALYNIYLRDWNRTHKVVSNNSSQSKIKELRDEYLWWNY